MPESTQESPEYLLYQEALDCLTPKQKIFVEIYDGNATKAYLSAGYKGGNRTAEVQGFRALRNTKIIKALGLRGPLPENIERAEQNAPKIANREDRQRFWSSVMGEEEHGMQFRLKASELLGKSNADFVERVQVDINLSLSVSAAIEKADLKLAGKDMLALEHDVVDCERIDQGNDTGK